MVQIACTGHCAKFSKYPFEKENPLDFDIVRLFPSDGDSISHAILPGIDFRGTAKCFVALFCLEVAISFYEYGTPQTGTPPGSSVHRAPPWLPLALVFPPSRPAIISFSRLWS